GIAVGLAAGVIFGSLPIVRAAGIRPLSVLRELPERGGWKAVALGLGLLVLLAALFGLLASVILQDPRLAAILVGSTAVSLAVLAGLFTLISALLSRLPVPERYSTRFLALVTALVLAAGGVTVVMRS